MNVKDRSRPYFCAVLMVLIGIAGGFLDNFRFKLPDLGKASAHACKAGQRGLARLSPEKTAAPSPLTASHTPPIDAPDPTPLPRPETGGHTAVINQIAVTRDGRLLSVSDDKTARLWPTASAGAPLVLRVPIGARSEGALYAAAVSPLKNSAVIAGETGIAWDKAGSVYAVDLANGEMTGRIAGIPGTVRVLSYSLDGRYLAIGSGSGWLRIVDISGKALALDSGICQDMLVAATFLRDGRLVTACLDGVLRLYGADFRQQAEYRFPPRQRPWRIAVSPHEDRVAVGSLDQAEIDLFSLADLKPVARLTGGGQQRGNLSVVAWIGDAVFGAGTYGDTLGGKYLRSWDVAGGKSREWRLAEDTVTDLAALPDGRLAYATAEARIGFIDPAGEESNGFKRSIADFRDAFEGTFAVAEDGTAVDFGLLQKGRAPVRFDWVTRTLSRHLPARADMHPAQLPKALSAWRNSAGARLNSTPIVLDQNEFSRSAAGLPENGSVLIGADFSLQYWQAGRRRWQTAVPASAWAVNLTKNGRFALAALGDGTLRWYDARNGEERLALLVTSDERWIAWTPDGYFDHSDGAADLIGYHINQGKKDTPQFILSGQIHERFYRPDLIGKAVFDRVLPAASGADVKTVVTQQHAPAIKLLAWCASGQCRDITLDANGMPQAISTDSATITLRFALQDKGSGIGKVVVRRNKAVVATRGLRRDETSQAGHGDVIAEQTVSLEPGDNWLSVSAFDAHHSIDAGDGMRLHVHYQAVSREAPELYIVSVGIDRYAADTLPTLRNAASDAQGVVATLTQNAKDLFATVKPTVILDDQADLQHIVKALQDVGKTAKANDLVVLFLAGHGVAANGRYFFLPHDVKLSGTLADEALQASSLTQDVLSDLLSALPTSRVAVLIDSCSAGAFAVLDSVMRPSQERAWTGALAQKTGRFVLAATSTDQEALDGVNGHGVFTAVVLAALNGNADKEMAGNKDRHVNIAELLAYARQRVPEEAHKISPAHAQNVSGFFAGSEFFDLSLVPP